MASAAAVAIAGMIMADDVDPPGVVGSITTLSSGEAAGITVSAGSTVGALAGAEPESARISVRPGSSAAHAIASNTTVTNEISKMAYFIFAVGRSGRPESSTGRS